MNKHIVTFLLTMLLFSSICISYSIWKVEGISIFTSKGNTIYVGGIGPGNYTNIQNAINDANDGDTIFVYNGTYYENHILINKTLFLKGEDKNTTIIDGDEGGDIIYLTKDEIHLSGFTIRNSGNIKDTEGIFIYHANNCYIKDNNILLIQEHGIWCFRGNNNTISGNTINYIANGLVLTFSDNNKIINNNISNNGAGVILDESKNNLVTENIISNNYIGMGLCSFDSNIGRNTITRNNIIKSKQLGIDIDRSSYNKIEQNNLIGNKRHAKFYSSFYTQWKENYWGRQRMLPKPILGIYHDLFQIPYLNFDWYPAREPYDTSNL